MMQQDPKIQTVNVQTLPIKQLTMKRKQNNFILKAQTSKTSRMSNTKKYIFQRAANNRSRNQSLKENINKLYLIEGNLNLFNTRCQTSFSNQGRAQQQQNKKNTYQISLKQYHMSLDNRPKSTNIDSREQKQASKIKNYFPQRKTKKNTDSKFQINIKFKQAQNSVHICNHFQCYQTSYRILSSRQDRRELSKRFYKRKTHAVSKSEVQNMANLQITPW